MAAAQMPHSFQDFFKRWTAEQKHHLHELISATEASISTTPTTSRDSLVNVVIGHYEEYYRVKSEWAQENVLVIFSPPWRTELECPFLWIGGWRPSMAFHLLYSKSGLQLKAWLDQGSLITTSTTQPDDLGDLGPHQLGLVNQLQKKTVEEERKISEKMAKHQETIADQEMVQLSHQVSVREDEGDGNEQQVKSTLNPKEEGLKKLLKSADDLRLRTLKGVAQILSPNQALHFLIAAAELHLRLHDWGNQHKETNPTSNIVVSS